MARRKKTIGVVHPATMIPVRGGLIPAPTAPAAPKPGVLTPDSEYFAGAAQRAFALNQGLAANDAEATQLAAARTEALRRLSDQQPRDESAATIGANKAGLLHSTTLGNSLSDLAQSYIRQRSDVQSTYDTNEAARVAARKALEEGAPLDDAAARAEAADRQITRDSESAAANSLVPNPPAKPKVPRVTPTILKPRRRRRRVTMGTVRPSSNVVGY
jgi:hypothetical protein